MKQLFSLATDQGGRARRQPLLTLALLLLLPLALGACDALEEAGLTRVDNVQIGFVETGGLNNTRARFRTLSGRKAWRETLAAGDTLTLDYEAAVEKGSLTLQVETPQGDVLWETPVTAGEPVDGEVTLDAAADGTYTIVVFGEDAGGSYELAWEQSE